MAWSSGGAARASGIAAADEAGPGRALGPRGEARRRALLDAAARLFVTKGYEGTTLSELVDVAGGSRASIYDLFGDKAGLFRAMIEETNHRVIGTLATGRSPAQVTPDEALVRFARHFITSILNDDARAVVRVLVSESGRIPDIADEFWSSGPEVTARHVADYLRTLAVESGLRIDDPEAAARIFLGMVVGDLFIRSLIQPDHQVPDEEVERRVRYAVELFLDGIRVPAAVTGRS